MITIDGSHGEGGGQLVRMSCALAALTGQPVGSSRCARAVPRRASRPAPAAVQAVARLCNAETEDLALRTQEFTFRPGRFKAVSFVLMLHGRFDRAGAAKRCCGGARGAGCQHLHIIGGTDVKAAPSFDYFRYVFVPLLERLGLDVRATLVRRGYYPRVAAKWLVRVQPGRPAPLALDAPGALQELGGIAHVANLPAHIAERMQHTAIQILAEYDAYASGRSCSAMPRPSVGRRDRAVGAPGQHPAWWLRNCATRYPGRTHRRERGARLARGAVCRRDPRSARRRPTAHLSGAGRPTLALHGARLHVARADYGLADRAVSAGTRYGRAGGCRPAHCGHAMLSRRRFLAAGCAGALSFVSPSLRAEWLWHGCGPTTIPESLARNEFMPRLWQGVDAAQSWDCHVHLLGRDENGSGAWINRAWTASGIRSSVCKRRST